MAEQNLIDNAPSQHILMQNIVFSIQMDSHKQTFNVLIENIIRSAQTEKSDSHGLYSQEPEESEETEKPEKPEKPEKYSDSNSSSS